MRANGQPLSRSALSETVSRIALRAGSTRIQVRSHVIRHSVATLAVDSGADLPTATAMLSHSNTATISTSLHAPASRVNEARDRVWQIITASIPSPGVPAALVSVVAGPRAYPLIPRNPQNENRPT